MVIRQTVLTLKVFLIVAAAHFVCAIDGRLSNDVPEPLHRQGLLPFLIFLSCCGVLLFFQQNLQMRSFETTQ